MSALHEALCTWRQSPWKHYLSVSEFASLIGRNENTVRDLVWNGNIIAFGVHVFRDKSHRCWLHCDDSSLAQKA